MTVDFSQRDKLSPLERIKRLMAGEPIDRVAFNPFMLGFTARLSGIDRGTFYRNPERAVECGLAFMKAYPWTNASPAYGWADQGAWEFGGGVIWPDNDESAAPRSAGALISDPAQVDSLPDPDPETAGMLPLLDRFNAAMRQHGFPASLPGGSPTSLSNAIVGDANFMRWTIRYPEAVQKLQRKVTDYLLRANDVTIAKYGPENCGIMCAVPMDSNLLMSPEAFGRFSKPYIKEILGRVLEKGVKTFVVHLCGNHTGNLPLWKDMPLPPRTIFSIGHEMDLETTGQFIGKDHVLGGNVSTTLLQAGSPEEVYADTVRCLKAGMKHPGGYILMPACEFPPSTPLANLDALALAIYENGYY